jgi:hypothetical protein
VEEHAPYRAGNHYNCHGSNCFPKHSTGFPHAADSARYWFVTQGASLAYEFVHGNMSQSSESTGMGVPNEPLAERRLQWNDGGEERDVLVRLWQPVLYKGHYFCDYAVDGLPTPCRGYTGGVDSLQALILALSGIRSVLAPYRDTISWLGMVGSHGIPMGVQTWTNDAQELHRLEEFVESEAARALEELVAPKKERMAKFRARYDSTLNDDLTMCSTEDIIERLRAAAITEREYRVAGNDDVSFVFRMKGSDLIGALRERTEYQETLETLTAEADPAIRLHAARLLSRSPLAIAVLERLRDDGIEPEASEAQEILLSHLEEDERPKPWDE